MHRKHLNSFKIYITLILTSIILSGCWDVMEVNDLAIVIATGIDQIEDEQIEVTFLLYVPNPSGAASGEVSGSSKNSYSISMTGDTFSDAVMKLESEVPREIFWGHSNIFIFGSELAKNELGKQIDFLVRTAEPREQSQIYISQDKAKLEVDKFVSINTAELFSKLPKSRYLKSITLKDIEEMLVNNSQAGLIPISDTNSVKTSADTIDSFAVKGSAIIYHGKMISSITGEKDIGSQWLLFPKTNTPININPDGKNGKVSAETIKKSTKVTPLLEDKTWSINIKVKTDLLILQNSTSLDIYNPTVMNQLKKEFSKKIKADIEEFINHIQKDLKADVIQFYEAFHRSYPKETDDVKENWEEQFENIKVSIQVEVKIKNPGVTNLNIENK